MDFKQLKTSIEEISKIASSVPEPFRDKCFEILLKALLDGEKPADDKPDGGKEKGKEDGSHVKPPAGGPKVPMTTAIRVLMAKTGVTEEQLNKVALVEKDEVHFIRAPHPTKITDGQLEWSLMLALKNAILKNALETDPEEVRSKCQDVGFYDKANFAANFKRDKFTKVFKGTLTPQGKAVALSPEGQDALGELIKSLAGEAK
jgi:hypothetical protein